MEEYNFMKAGMWALWLPPYCQSIEQVFNQYLLGRKWANEHEMLRMPTGSCIIADFTYVCFQVFCVGNWTENAGKPLPVLTETWIFHLLKKTKELFPSRCLRKSEPRWCLGLRGPSVAPVGSKSFLSLMKGEQSHSFTSTIGSTVTMSWSISHIPMCLRPRAPKSD